MRAVLLVSLLAIACSAPAPRSPEPTETAASILARMAAAYREARSYSDRGTVTAVTDPSTPASTVAFSTAFVRPDGFRFELRVPAANRTLLAWLADGDAYVQWSAQPGPAAINRTTSLAATLDAMAPLSYGASQLVPAQLGIPGLATPFVSALRSPVLGEITMVAGRPCWSITSPVDDGVVELYIDRDSYVLRRMVREAPDARGRALRTTIDYEPRVDGHIDDIALRGPPAPSGTATRPRRATWIGVFFDRRTNLVKGIVPASPAAQAGVRAGDRIVTMGGVPVADAPTIIARVGEYQAGERVELGVERDGAAITILITIAARPDDRELQRAQLLDKPAPDLTLTTLDGAPLALSSLRGRVVVLDFWATWCGPCVVAMPHLVAWHTRYAARGLTIVGIADEDAATVKAFVTEHALPYPIVLDPEHATWRDYLVQAIPTTVIVDRTGVVRFVETGLGEPSLVEKAIEGLLR